LRPELDRLIADMRKSGRTLPEDLPGALRIRSEMALDEGNAEEAEAAALEAVEAAENRLGAQSQSGRAYPHGPLLWVRIERQAGTRARNR
jgi:hypothetical protein